MAHILSLFTHYKYHWDVSKFANVPRKFWYNLEHQRSFMDGLAKKLNIEDKEDWYKVKGPSLLEHGGGRLLMIYNGSMSKLLSSVYPEYPTFHYPLTRLIQVGYVEIWIYTTWLLE